LIISILTSTLKPPEIDHTSSKTTVYVRSDFEQIEVDGEQMWRFKEVQYPKLEYLSGEALNRIELSSDKTTIIADGVDAATITARLPVNAEYCFITVNGEVAEKAIIEKGIVTRAFTSETPGVYRVDFHALNRIATAFIEVIESA
jgi:hypothetical protein